MGVPSGPTGDRGQLYGPSLASDYLQRHAGAVQQYGASQQTRQRSGACDYLLGCLLGDPAALVRRTGSVRVLIGEKRSVYPATGATYRQY